MSTVSALPGPPEPGKRSGPNARNTRAARRITDLDSPATTVTDELYTTCCLWSFHLYVWGMPNGELTVDAPDYTPRALQSNARMNDYDADDWGDAEYMRWLVGLDVWLDGFLSAMRVPCRHVPGELCVSCGPDRDVMYAIPLRSFARAS